MRFPAGGPRTGVGRRFVAAAAGVLVLAASSAIASEQSQSRSITVNVDDRARELTLQPAPIEIAFSVVAGETYSTESGDNNAQRSCEVRDGAGDLAHTATRVDPVGSPTTLVVVNPFTEERARINKQRLAFDEEGELIAPSGLTLAESADLKGLELMAQVAREDGNLCASKSVFTQTFDGLRHTQQTAPWRGRSVNSAGATILFDRIQPGASDEVTFYWTLTGNYTGDPGTTIRTGFRYVLENHPCGVGETGHLAC